MTHRGVLTAVVLAMPARLLAQSPPIEAALERLRLFNEWTLTQQVELCQVAAPPFKEAARAAEFKRRLELLNLKGVRIDAEGNVIAERPGARAAPRVVLSAHLDTVFGDSIDVTVRRNGTRFEGPGIGDDCRGLAVVLATARALQEGDIRTSGPVVFVGTVGEEGVGNMRGVRHLIDRQSAGGRVDYFISVDGIGLTAVTRAVGSHRYRVTVRGPGGHSFGDFGIPNPIHALGRAIAGIAQIQVPSSPRTTFSVGVIEGGTSVNAIAMSASMDIDLRSESQEALDSLDARMRRAVQAGVDAERARWPGTAARLVPDFREIGKRPAASQPDTAQIARATLAAARALGFIPALVSSSNDTNYPMSLGIPSVAIDGGGSGGSAHSTGEWYDDGKDGWRGPQWALLLVLSLAGLSP
ncbi:MAG TPA: M20/M25/M40 family metallo-hydrolase [Gemmatimonadales bacterium]|nr:M20/M25/M40 family metallo-hydrolase [Gemmatimonadales bacterium]